VIWLLAALHLFLLVNVCVQWVMLVELRRQRDRALRLLKEMTADRNKLLFALQAGTFLSYRADDVTNEPRN